MFGLTADEIKIIVDAIKSQPKIDEAIIFGSRALNTYKKGSDIDIALKGNNIEPIVTNISGLLNDESPLPYFLDVLDYNSITNEDLRQHIDRVGITVYKRLI